MYLLVKSTYIYLRLLQGRLHLFNSEVVQMLRLKGPSHEMDFAFYDMYG
jgi:hypothetical protein